jgi:phenylacetate-coenzyme A ligase PaaK-like adenylate-forming protein
MVNNWRELLLGPWYFYHRILINRSKKRYFKPIISKSENSINIRRKKDYLLNLKNYENPYFHFLTHKVSTGGTSGSPFIFHRSIFSSLKERAYIFDIWGSIKYKPFDLRVIFRGNISKKLITYNWFENAYIISPNQLCASNRDLIIKFLTHLKAFYLHVYPSSFFTLSNYLGENVLKSLKIQGILAGSENFPLGQMELIAKRYQLPIAYWYGHSEYAVLARYCFKCHGFHFYPTYGKVDFVERVDSKFSIIANSFNRLGTRFINYDTEDLAILDNLKCSIDNFPRIKTIIGREQEFYFGKDGSTHAFGPYLFGIHNRFWEYLVDIQFIQNRIGELVVYISTNHSYIRDIEDILNDRFSNVTLHFVYLKNIDKTKNGKHRYFIQMVK